MATTKIPNCPDCKQPIRPAGWSDLRRMWECGCVHPAEVAGVRSPHEYHRWYQEHRDWDGSPAKGVTQHDMLMRDLTTMRGW